MIFLENRLLADDSHEISFLTSFENEKDVANVSSAAVMIGALRVNGLNDSAGEHFQSLTLHYRTPCE